ncbi:Ras-related protein RHN1 [Senna tora]|uniref:Ras-related protein RHN1 n=1 Tax=Senna tora TaxID=362788 RepID=A0A834X733_9FABA|nr:Ras-related protein RHN1 [Senna tora]
MPSIFSFDDIESVHYACPRLILVIFLFSLTIGFKFYITVLLNNPFYTNDLIGTIESSKTLEARVYAKENGLFFMETSAKSAANVNEIFYEIGIQLLKCVISVIGCSTEISCFVLAKENKIIKVQACLQKTGKKSIITTFSVVDTMKWQFYAQQGKTSSL